MRTASTSPQSFAGIDLGGLPERLPPKLIRRLAWLLDECIPIGPWAIGFDGLIGLIPGVGDVLGSLLSAWIILSATRDGVPRATIARMMANLAIDTALGAVPFLGDLFDFLFKSNTRNLKLYQLALDGRGRPRHDALYVATVIAGLLILLATPVVLMALLIRAILR
ncbi:MAG: DUF4112 domain-containing protein [Bryobacterales bacterium]|nr:DUF4112 domain-containing protein [Bryobacterales bacterium]